MTVTPLAEARQALDRGEWAVARGLVAESDAAASDEGLQIRAAAAYGCGDLETTVASWEGLHTLRLQSDDPTGAAHAACKVALHLLMDTGLMAPVRGWISRAERALGGSEPGAAHAIIAMVRAYERFLSGDAAASEDHAAVAVDLGERFGVTAAVVVGRTATGRLKILNGDVVSGLAVLDEVAATLMDGAVDVLTTGIMYCELICAAQGLAMPDRAREWTELMERWRHGTAVGPVNGRCRVHRAELLRMSGPGDAAEREALGACVALRP